MWLSDLKLALARFEELGLYPVDACFDGVKPATDGLVFYINNGSSVKWFSATGRVVKYAPNSWRTGVAFLYDSDEN